jgi:hypothetical protein
MTGRDMVPSVGPEEYNFPVRDLPDDAVIWRYMDLGKFLSLLSTSSLYFSSIKMLSSDDAYEGIPPSAYYEEWRRKWPHLPSDVRTHLCGWTGRALGQTTTSLEDLITLFRNQYERLSRTTFVNCWYSGEHESAAMWTLYAARGSGIAIRTTARRLKTALRVENPNTEFMYRLVCYYNHTAQELPNLAEGINTCAFLKRNSYAHESEYRAAFEVLSEASRQPCGMEFKCDLKDLVERVVISPYAKEYIVSPIVELLEKYDLKCEAGKSRLNEVS